MKWARTLAVAEAGVDDAITTLIQNRVGGVGRARSGPRRLPARRRRVPGELGHQRRRLGHGHVDGLLPDASPPRSTRGRSRCCSSRRRRSSTRCSPRTTSRSRTTRSSPASIYSQRERHRRVTTRRSAAASSRRSGSDRDGERDRDRASTRGDGCSGEDADVLGRRLDPASTATTDDRGRREGVGADGRRRATPRRPRTRSRAARWRARRRPAAGSRRLPAASLPGTEHDAAAPSRRSRRSRSRRTTTRASTCYGGVGRRASRRTPRRPPSARSTRTRALNETVDVAARTRSGRTLAVATRRSSTSTDITLSGDLTIVTNAPIDFGNTGTIGLTAASPPRTWSSSRPTSRRGIVVHDERRRLPHLLAELDRVRDGDDDDLTDGVAGLVYTPGKMAVKNQGQRGRRRALRGHDGHQERVQHHLQLADRARSSGSGPASSRRSGRS